MISAIQQFLAKILGLRRSEPEVVSKFHQRVVPDEKLAVIVGPGPLLRTEISARIWTYIGKHNLQDPKDPLRIHADEALRPLFKGRDSVTMFEMNKYLPRHFDVKEEGASPAV